MTINVDEVFKHTVKKPNRIGMKLLGFKKVPSFVEYKDKLLSELLKNDTLENILFDFRKRIKKTETFNLFLKYIIDKYDFSDIYKKIKTNDTVLLSAYFNGELKYCLNCGKPIKNNKYCSLKCSNNSEIVKQLKEQTLFSNYGVTTGMHSTVIRDKIKKTYLENYGVEYGFQSQIVKDKTKKTNLEKYGVEHPATLDYVKDKAKKTNLERYGVDHALQLKEYQDKVKKTNLERYGVDIVSKSKEVRNKLKIALFKTFKHTNQENFNEKYIRENFIENDKFKLKEFCEYFNIRNRSGACKIKRMFEITEPNDDVSPNTGHSKMELELFEWIPIENKISGDRTIIKPLELDIYLPSYKIAIEYDGTYYHSNLDKDYHLNKTKLCETKGIQLLHIFDFDNIDIWKSMILNKLGKSEKIYARKCNIKELNYEQIKDFLIDNHLQGECRSSINIGLFYNDELVQVMTFGKPRFNNNYDYEIIRLCTKKYFHIVGGVSKLFNYFKKKYKGSIITYANKRFSYGEIYKVLGFTKIGETQPNYFYVKNTEVLSRYQCQKHKLSNLLENFDPNLSESDNMLNNGYLKIYDCGNCVFTYNNK